MRRIEGFRPHVEASAVFRQELEEKLLGDRPVLRHGLHSLNYEVLRKLNPRLIAHQQVSDGIDSCETSGSAVRHRTAGLCAEIRPFNKGRNINLKQYT